MHKSGVLKSEQMPRLGGDIDSPKLEYPVRAIRDWDKLRKSRKEAMTGSKKAVAVGKQPSSADGSTTSLLSTARSWENVGQIGVKRWGVD